MLLEKAEFTVFDFETTGLYPYTGDRICEIGAVRFGINSRRPRIFHALVDPMRSVSPGAFRVNGITESMFKGKPTIEEVMPDFLGFIADSALVAYNAQFDMGFLEAALGGATETIKDYYIIDALSLARRLFPGIGRYGLGSVADFLNVETGREHRALSDAMMTWRVFRKELAVLKSEGARTVEDIERFRTRQAGITRAEKDPKSGYLEEAIRLRKRLNITYRSSWKDGITTRTITPKKIRLGYGSSYLIAYCHLREEERTFRLDCILKADMV